MFRNNIIKPVNQFWFPERDVRGAFLKVFNSEHFIFIALFTLNRLNVVIQMNSDVFPAIGDGFAAEQMQHSFQIGNPEKSHPYIEDMAMFLSPLPVVLEWHCVMCEQLFHGKKFCDACGTGIYCRAVCTKSVYSYQPDLFQDS